MQQKQVVIEKLLDLPKNRFQNNCFELTSKTPNNRLSNFNKMNLLNLADGSRENPQSDVQQRETIIIIIQTKTIIFPRINGDW